MTLRVALIVLGLLSLGGYAATIADSPAASPGMPTASQAPLPSSATHALSGVWEGFGPDDLPIRLVVEEVHENWASLTYSWGEHPDGKFHKGWVRVRAKVLPDGKLFWRHPGDFTFQLSEDWTTLVGARTQGGASANSLMRRVPSGVALNTLTTKAQAE